MLFHLLPAICASVFGAVGCQQDQATGVRPPHAKADVTAPRDTVLAPIADTYIRQGRPNQNQGAELILRLESLLKNRSLLRWDQQALAQVVAGGTVTAAHLELTIADLRDNWGTAGRTIEVHRMTQAWTELGATWNCAVDSEPGNLRTDCAGPTAWDMDHSGSYPWVPAPTATALLRNGQTGVVSFDVTADVQAWLSGQPNDGWVLKKTVEGAAGKVDFGSRESATPPRLVLSLGASPTSWPLLADSYPTLDTTRVVRHPTDSALVYFRTDIVLRFKVGASDSTKAAFFARNSLQVLGVTRSGQFFVRMPDPGSDLQSFYDAVDRLESDAAILLVAPVPRQPWPQANFTRLPTDGPSQARGDWLSSSNGTWAMRAIRAPLAWGCETGEYGGTAVPVGLFEWKHERTHPEFQTSSPRLWEPPDALLKNVLPKPPDTVSTKQAHAVATDGLLSARGDNGSGIAGMNWRTRLFMYAGYSANNRPLDLTTGFYLLSQAISADRVQVLSLSADAEFPESVQSKDKERIINDVMAEMQFSLIPDSSPLLVVVAAGNERYLGSVAAYPAAHHVALLRAALLRLAQDSRYKDRIVVVTGTGDGNQFWIGSNLFTAGATDVAAPAANVTVLGPWHGETGPAVPVTAETGTSLSAPLVAGVAAQLWEMDPDLTPREVKGYILRGARRKRFRSATGDSADVSPIAGASETIYQLDAYGALTLLSAERPGTPICGFPVSVSAGNRQTVLERPGLPESFNIGADSDGIAAISVAQGGRLISALMQHPDGSYGSVVVDHHGAVQATVPGAWRVFLERDTVDGPAPWMQNPDPSRPDPTYILRRGTGGAPTLVHPFSRVPTRPRCIDGMVAFSPSGEQLMLAMQTWWPTGECSFDNANAVELWLMPVDSASSARLTWTSSSADPIPWYLLWSHDSRRLISVTYTLDLIPFQVTSVTEDGTAQEFPVAPNWEPYDLAYSADDSAVVSVEPDSPSWWLCSQVRRNPATWAATSAPRPLGSCGEMQNFRIFPTAPPARPSLAAGSDASQNGAGLREPGPALQRAVHTRQQPVWGSRRVQVN